MEIFNILFIISKLLYLIFLISFSSKLIYDSITLILFGNSNINLQTKGFLFKKGDSLIFQIYKNFQKIKNDMTIIYTI